MADVSQSSSTASDVDDGSITVSFSLFFNVAKCVVWWGLWLLALTYAFARRRVVSRAWFIYTMLLSVICFNAIQSSAYVGYASHVQQGHNSEGLIGYLVYLLFFNVSRSAFLAVLMVVASGYCITRSDLGPHKQHVVFVPTTVLVTGVITDFSFFFYALSSDKAPNADTYDLGDIGALAAGLWFVCSVLNLSALILAWLYIFEALGKETSAMEEDYQRRTGKLREQQDVQPEAPTQTGPGNVQYAALGYGAAPDGPSQPPAPPAADLEAAEEGATVADQLAYDAKKKVLTRFAAGVAAYLVADICVLMLPVFFNYVVQSTLQVLLFVCYLAFIVVLLVLFRPQEQSSYLMVGFNEEDAEQRGVNQLHTGIAMGELESDGCGRGGDGRGGEHEAAAAAAAAGSWRSGVPALGIPVSDGASAGPPAAAVSKSALRAAAKTTKKGGSDAYGQLSGAPSSSDGGRDGGGGGAGSANPFDTADPALFPPASRARQPRKYVPQRAPQSAGQFTLGDEDEDLGANTSSRLLGAGGKGAAQ